MQDRKLQGTLAYVGLTIFGIIWVITSILGLAKVDLGTTGLLIVNLFRSIAVLLIVLVVAFVGWEVASEKATLWKVFYIIVAALSIVGAVLGIVAVF